MGDTFRSIGSSIEDAFSPYKPFGSPVDPTKAEYDFDTGTPENIEALRLAAEYDPDTGEPLNASAMRMEKLYDEYVAKEDSKSKFDVGKALEGASKIGDFSPKVIGKTSRQPGVDMPSVSGGRYSPQQSPYAAPSYLQGSTDYNKQVGQLVQALLRGQIRGRSIKSLI